MNKQTKTEEDNRKLYKIPSGGNYQLRSKNAIYVSPSNTIHHELSKCLGAYMLRKWGDIKFSERTCAILKMLENEVKLTMKDFPKDRSAFITEAVPKKEPDRRVDLVRLNDNQRFEFETNPKIKKENCCTIYI